MAADKMFQQALEAIENGERVQAQKLLYRLVEIDDQNIDYWLYLSSVLDKPKEIRSCIDKALEIDPQNATALRGIRLLSSSPLKLKFNPVRPNPKRKYYIPEVLSKSTPEAPKKKRAPIPRKQMFRWIFLSLAGLSLIYVGIFGNPFSENPVSYILPSLEDLRPLPATRTATATAFIPTNTPSPVPLTLTQISISNENSSTPSPRILDTPHPGSEAYNSGIEAFDMGDYELAIENFLKHLLLFPRDPVVRFYLGQAYFQIGEYKNADTSFIWASDINPEFGLAYLWEVLSKLEYLKKPVISKKLHLAVIYAPDQFHTYLERGKNFLRNLSMDLAYNDLEKALELAPDNASVHLFAANYYLANDLEQEALSSAQIANELDPTIPEIYYVLGMSYFENLLYEDANSSLQSYLYYEPQNAEAWLLLGRAQQKLGLHQDALASFEEVENINNSLLKVYLYIGISNFELGDFVEAFSQFDFAYQYYPNTFEAILYYGVSLMERGRIGDGYIEISASSRYAFTEDQLALLYYWRAQSLERLGKPENAKSDWENLLALDAQYVRAQWVETASQALLGNYFTATPSP